MPIAAGGAAISLCPDVCAGAFADATDNDIKPDSVRFLIKIIIDVGLIRGIV